MHARLVAKFGEPSSSTKYVHRWNLADGLDIVTERRGSVGKAWTAWPGNTAASQIYFGFHRTPDRRVNSNVYSKRSAPSLAHGELLEMSIPSTTELDAMIAWLEARIQGLPPPKIQQPTDELVETDEQVDTQNSRQPVSELNRDSRADRQKLKRRTISQSVRWEVWRRDQGECVRCGSRERLEYDHIIPVSKGGGNSARNIELLCERCNRSKGALIQG